MCGTQELGSFFRFFSMRCRLWASSSPIRLPLAPTLSSIPPVHRSKVHEASPEVFPLAGIRSC